MENASKALIMAGGMLLAILIVSLLIYAWSLFSKYQSSNDSLADVEDTTKFNEQFANYDRKGVQGYELLSLVNKVIDYNYRKSSDSQAKNDDKYTPITLKISLGAQNQRKKLTKDETIRVFTGSGDYVQSDTVNKFEGILTNMQQIENRYGSADAANKVAKGIDSIFLSDQQLTQNRNLGKSDDDSWADAIKKFNACTTKLKVSDKASLLAEKENAYKYYEYMQFKRAKFDSVSSAIKYDNSTGRIYYMEFSFTGNLY